MRTTLDIDAELIEDALRLSGLKTKAAVVEVALREYVRLRRKEMLLGLPGRVRLGEDLRALGEAELDESG